MNIVSFYDACVLILIQYYYWYMYVAGYVWIGNEFEGVDDAEDEEVSAIESISTRM